MRETRHIAETGPVPATDSAALSTIRLAILDDHILVVDGLAKWLQVNAPDVTVVVAASSWSELVDALPLQVNVVVMAQYLDGAVSVQTRIRQCVAAGAKVVIISSIDSTEFRAESLDAGASAFVSKALPAADVLTAVRRAHNPDSPLTPAADDGSPTKSGDGSVLDHDDLIILRLYANGLSTVDIAIVREVKFEVVRATLKRIRERYASQGRLATTRDELLRWAAEDGYLA